MIILALFLKQNTFNILENRDLYPNEITILEYK